MLSFFLFLSLHSLFPISSFQLLFFLFFHLDFSFKYVTISTPLCIHVLIASSPSCSLASVFSSSFHSFLLFFLLSMSFIISLRLSFLKLVFYNLFISLCHVDCYIQFPSSSTCNMTSSAGSNSFNSPFFIFLWQFLVSKLIFFSLAYSL